MKEKRILVVDDEQSMRHMLKVLLGKEGYEVEEAAEAQEALAKAKAEEFNIILCDLRMPGMDGMSLLEKAKAEDITATFIMMSAYGTMDTAIEAMKKGAYDYISKPFRPDEIILTLKKTEERERLRRENRTLRAEILREYSFANMVARSHSMQRIFETIQKVADFKTTVLIEGESGTGKELIARAIHFNGVRRDKPFLTVNCAAIPEALLESELFGHEKGAFTGAVQRHMGKFEQCHTGTIFLDEVGDMSISTQSKLLRVLQEEEFQRVGGSQQIVVDVRVIAATNQPLEQRIREGRFREDLFYRLNVLRIKVAPLRERREDIQLLAEHFIQKYNRRLGMKIKGITKRALGRLLRYDWPGNVRELENAIERSMVLCEGDMLDEKDLPPLEPRGDLAREGLGDKDADLSLKRHMKEAEQAWIRKVLEKTGGNRSRAARLLGITHRALLYKMKEYGIP